MDSLAEQAKKLRSNNRNGSVATLTPISKHPTVQDYLSRKVTRKIDYEKEIQKRKLRQGRTGPAGREATVRELWELFKYGVMGLQPEGPEDRENTDGPDGDYDAGHSLTKGRPEKPLRLPAPKDYNNKAQSAWIDSTGEDVDYNNQDNAGDDTGAKISVPGYDEPDKTLPGGRATAVSEGEEESAAEEEVAPLRPPAPPAQAARPPAATVVEPVGAKPPPPATAAVVTAAPEAQPGAAAEMGTTTFGEAEADLHKKLGAQRRAELLAMKAKNPEDPYTQRYADGELAELDRRDAAAAPPSTPKAQPRSPALAPFTPPSASANATLGSPSLSLEEQKQQEFDNLKTVVASPSRPKKPAARRSDRPWKPSAKALEAAKADTP